MLLLAALLATPGLGLRTGLQDQTILGSLDVDSQNIDDTIVKAKKDPREYRAITLDNGLPVVLIRDHTTATSSASMDIHVGSFWDPAAVPGIAHFLEHMLFLGSKKYPHEGSFDALLQENGGYSNAYTASENTNYFFRISNSHFSQATDMFAQMFISPLLTVNATGREAHAINAEHSKNHQNDGWRLQQIKQDLADPTHVFNRFETGNAATLLSDVNLSHKTLTQLYKGHYCVPNMHLTMLSSAPLNETESLVHAAFATLPQACSPEGDKEVGIGATVGKKAVAPFNASVVQSLVKVKTISETHGLTFTWQTSPKGPDAWRTKASEYIGSIIGQEGKGSLTSLLRKEKGWVNSLSAGTADDYASFSTFELDMSLTEAGTKHITDIGLAVHHYLSLLRSEDGITLARFNEKKASSQLDFDYKEKESPEDYTSGVAASMRFFPLKDVLRADHSFVEFSASAVRSLLEELTPSNLVVFYAQQFPDTKFEHEDKYYGAKYSIEKIKESELQLYTSALTGKANVPSDIQVLTLPSANPYVVDDTSVKAVKETGKDTPVATLIQNEYQNPVEGSTSRTVGWWLQDTQFLMPKTSATVTIYRPKRYQSAKERMIAELYAALVTDSLSEAAYPAGEMGYGFQLTTVDTGLQVSVSGFTQHLPEFTTLILDGVASPKLNPDRFKIIVKQYERSLRNSLIDEPYKLIGGYLDQALESPVYTPKQLLEVLSIVTIKEVEAFKPSLVDDAAVEAFVFGDASREDAQTLISLASTRISAKVATPSLLQALPSLQSTRVARIKEGSNPVFKNLLQDPKNPNACVEMYYQYGKCSEGAHGLQSKLYLQVLASLANGPSYQQLRTKEQLGYIVSSGPDSRNDVLGFKLLVESAIKPAGYLSQRITSFMDNILDPMIENLQAEKFQALVSTIRSSLSAPEQSASQVNEAAFSEIFTRQYMFKRRQIELKLLSNLNVTEFKSFYQKLRSGRSVAIALSPRAQQVKKEGDNLTSATERLSQQEYRGDNISTWRTKQDEYAAVSPKPLPKCSSC